MAFTAVMLLVCAPASAVGTGTVTVSTVAGVPAQFDKPDSICADSSGNFYVADTFNSVIRKISAGGVVTVLAGVPGLNGALDGTGSGAYLASPQGICFDGPDNCLFVTDTSASTIRKVTLTGKVTTIAGTAYISGSTDSPSLFYGPSGICYDTFDGNLYVTDSGNDTIRKVTTAGVVTTIAGLAQTFGSTDSPARFNYPCGICYDPTDRNLYVTDTDNSLVRRVSTAGVVTTIAGHAGWTGWLDGTGTSATFSFPQGVCYSGDGNLYVTDTNSDTIRQVTTAGVVGTFAGSGGSMGSDNGTGNAARFWQPRGLCAVGTDLYVTDSWNDAVRKVTSAKVVTTFAGPATIFDRPTFSCADAAGNVYFADANDCVIRKVTPSGTVSVLAGVVGTYGWADGAGDAARFANPDGICYDSADGNLYVSDGASDTIRRVSLTGVVTTIAGLQFTHGSVDGTGADARFDYPVGIAYDSADGCLYVTDTNNDTVRQVTTAGVVKTIAGSPGVRDWSDGSGGTAHFWYPRGLCYDAADNALYVTDTPNHTIRRVTTDGTVTTFAGTHLTAGVTDETGSAARFGWPEGIAYDAADGDLYVTDGSSFTIRRITPAAKVTTVAGTANIAGASDGVGAAARFFYDTGLCYNPSDGRLYVTDSGNDTLRALTVDYAPPTTTATGLVADAHSGWQRSGLLTLSRTLDGTSYYRIDGGAAQTYAAPVAVGADGSHVVSYWSVGPGGAVETPHTGYVNLDVSAPTTKASGIPAGWSKTPVTVTLTGNDSLSGCASTEYRLQGAAAWSIYTAPFAVTAQGVSTYEFRSTDAVGNVEAAQTFTAKVDAKGPQTLALAKVSVTKGKKATFRFRINDLTPTATVTIKIYKHNKLKKTIPVGSAAATNSAQSYKWTCKLAKGSYTWKVYATDLAGNAQISIGSKKLAVK